MLNQKIIKKVGERYVNVGKYTCDMCKKEIEKKDRFLVAISQRGKDPTRKRWDLCPKCMKTIDKNVALWYDKVINNK